MSALPSPIEPAETADTFPLDTRPLSDPDAIAERDAEWLAKVYARGEAQLTVRAAVTGMALGAILGASNLYIGLKVGWNFGMSITASVLAFAIFGAFRKLVPGMRPFSMLENNTSQTAASAAAYMSSAGLVSSIPAMQMLIADGTIHIPELDGWRLSAWLLAISILGVVVAIPLKRSLINAEQLRFPSGVVCAETIRTMHASGEASMGQARSLVGAGIGAAVLKFVFDCKLWVFKALPELVPLPGKIGGVGMSAWSFGFNTSLLLYAAGAIVGMKVAASLALGALVDYGVLGPWLLDHRVLRVASPEVAADPAAWNAFRAGAEAVHAIPIKTAEGIHAAIRSKWSVWPGTAMMVTASLVAFGFRWRTVARALGGLGKLFGKGGATRDPLAEVEVPQAWFAIGLLACGTAAVAMQKAWFDVPVLEGIVSVLAAFVLSVVAARATGETDVTPIGAMGKITQLLFGVLVPGNAAANLMTATVTAGAASHSADLLTEVKTGYLLGGAPRKQFWAQILGCLAGAAACVPAYFVIAQPEKLGNEIAAPAAMAWMSVAKLLKDGADNLPAYAMHGIAIGGAIGVVLALCDELAPKRVKPWIPSATGIGIAFVIDANDSMAMFIGAVLVAVLTKLRKDLADKYVVSSASGIIAGEGLMGIAVLAAKTLGWLPD
jgi:uncharacterized oligopeptide transporter (OPT) family protein